MLYVLVPTNYNVWFPDSFVDDKIPPFTLNYFVNTSSDKENQIVVRKYIDSVMENSLASQFSTYTANQRFRCGPVTQAYRDILMQNQVNCIAPYNGTSPVVFGNSVAGTDFSVGTIIAIATLIAELNDYRLQDNIGCTISVAKSRINHYLHNRMQDFITHRIIKKFSLEETISDYKLVLTISPNDYGPGISIELTYVNYTRTNINISLEISVPVIVRLTIENMYKDSNPFIPIPREEDRELPVPGRMYILQNVQHPVLVTSVSVVKGHRDKFCVQYMLENGTELILPSTNFIRESHIGVGWNEFKNHTVSIA